MNRSNSVATFWDFQGHYASMTVEEALARRLTNWKGWLCSAGSSSLYIDFDGDIYRATCRVGGLQGNIYKDLPEEKEWVSCTRDYCICGVDISLPKVKNSLDKSRLLKKEKELFVKEFEAVTGPRASALNHPVKTITWDIGRRCNYDCSYCIPEIHNKTDAFKRPEELLEAAQKVLQYFVKDQKAKFYFAGGEPTLYPGFLEVVKYLYSNGHEVSVTTNGSQKAKFYKELIHYANITMSVHFEFAKEERLLENVMEVLQTIVRSQVKARPIYNWFGMKLMTPPGGVEKSVSFARKLYRIVGFKKYVAMGFHPLWQPQDPQQLYKYSAEDLEFFKRYNTKESIDSLLRPSLVGRVRNFLQI